jgi:signal transduction histidine kinase
MILSTGGQVKVDPLPAVVGDAVQMRLLLQNLVGNALKYHKPGEPPQVRLFGEVSQMGDKRQARIVVEDQGIGFDQAYQEKIFQPFVRLHGRSQYEGSGMGLAICRRIVEGHGGTLTASSQPGQGSRFMVSLPLPE